MSNSFSVKPQKLKVYKADMDSAYKSLVSYNNEMADMLNNLNTYSGYANVRRRLRDACNGSKEDANIMQQYLRALEDIAALYETTERRICDSTSVGGVHLVEIAPGNTYPVDGIQDDISWWDTIEEFIKGCWNGYEQWLMDIPEEMRWLLMINPFTSTYGLLPYILENDYLRTAYHQAILGDFTEESNALGVALSVAIGIIPIVGLIADVRDLIADIYNLVDDGQETKEWVALGFSAAAIIPVVGDYLKHSDTVADIIKHYDRLEDLVKKADDFVCDASKKVDDFKKLWDEKVIKKITEPIKKQLKKPIPDKWEDFAKNVLNKDITDETTVGDLLKELGKEEVSEIFDVPTDLEGWMEKMAEKHDAYKAGNSYGFEEAFPGIVRTKNVICSAFN